MKIIDRIEAGLRRCANGTAREPRTEYTTTAVGIYRHLADGEHATADETELVYRWHYHPAGTDGTHRIAIPRPRALAIPMLDSLLAKWNRQGRLILPAAWTYTRED